MATGTFSSATVNQSGTQTTVLWTIATTWGTLSIQSGKSAYITVGVRNIQLVAIVSQSDPGGSGTDAEVVFRTSETVPTGTATFTAESGFLRDAFANITPASTGAAVTNGSLFVGDYRQRNRSDRNWRAP